MLAIGPSTAMEVGQDGTYSTQKPFRHLILSQDTGELKIQKTQDESYFHSTEPENFRPIITSRFHVDKLHVDIQHPPKGSKRKHCVTFYINETNLLDSLEIQLDQGQVACDVPCKDLKITLEKGEIKVGNIMGNIDLQFTKDPGVHSSSRAHLSYSDALEKPVKLNRHDFHHVSIEPPKNAPFFLAVFKLLLGFQTLTIHPPRSQGQTRPMLGVKDLEDLEALEGIC